MKSKTKFTAALLAIFVIAGCGLNESDTAQLRFRILAPKGDFVNVPVYAMIELPKQFTQVPVEEISVVLKEEGKAGPNLPGQIIMGQEGKAQLWWILPQAKAQSVSTWVATLSHREKTNQKVFCWKDKTGNYLDLLFNGRKVIRYMYAYDDSSPQRLLQTYKPFHHVFDAQGENFLTNGNEPDSLYPHHRGLFIGWKNVQFKGREYNFWYLDKNKGMVQKHQKFLQQTAGPVLAKSKALIHWNDRKGQPIIVEQRKTTVFRQPDPTILLLEFRTQLKAVNGDVFLDSDPEHGGFQFRAHNDIVKGPKELKAAYLFHKDGIDPHKDKDLPWTALVYGLNGRRYTVQHINHPDNPKPTMYSAYRDYGRFGAFFKQKIKAGETLTLRYRISIVEGKIPQRQEMTSKYLAFVNGPKVEVLSYE